MRIISNICSRSVISYPVNFDRYRIAVKSGDQEEAVAFIDHYLEQYIFDGPLMISQLRNLGVLIFHNTISVLMRGQIPVQEPEQVREAAPEPQAPRQQYREEKQDLNDPDQQLQPDVIHAKQNRNHIVLKKQ